MNRGLIFLRVIDIAIISRKKMKENFEIFYHSSIILRHEYTTYQTPINSKYFCLQNHPLICNENNVSKNTQTNTLLFIVTSFRDKKNKLSPYLLNQWIKQRQYVIEDLYDFFSFEKKKCHHHWSILSNLNPHYQFYINRLKRKRLFEFPSGWFCYSHFLMSKILSSGTTSDYKSAHHPIFFFVNSKFCSYTNNPHLNEEKKKKTGKQIILERWVVRVVNKQKKKSKIDRISILTNRNHHLEFINQIRNINYHRKKNNDMINYKILKMLDR